MAALRQKAELGCASQAGSPCPCPACPGFLELQSKQRRERLSHPHLTPRKALKAACVLLMFRRFLRHQYNAQLNRRTQQIKEELVSLSEPLGIFPPSFEVKHFLFLCM